MSDNTTTARPVHLDDVRAALAGTDPTATNAGALRKTLGRGSLSTIQKHLDTIRSEQAKPAIGINISTPEMPKDLMQGVWAHAWAQAQTRTAGALAQALATQEAQAAAIATARADAEAAQLEADAATQALAQQEQAHTAALAALETAQQALQQEQQARALEQAKHEAAIAALRGELDRLVSQLADLRAALGTKPTKRNSGEQQTILPSA